MSSNKNKGEMRSIILAIMLSVSVCATARTKAATYYEYETRCLGSELDGSNTLLAWGEGRNRADAIEQAKKNAVRDVIFKGIKAGNGGCQSVPLLNIPNAQERFEEYFSIFFADGGEYLKYVSMADQRILSKDKQKYKYGRKMSVTVRVERLELKKRLQADGVLPKAE